MIRELRKLKFGYYYLAIIFKLNLTDVWHFMKVFAWCMSFSIVINVKELLFRMREKKRVMCLWKWIEPKIWKKGDSLYSIVTVRDFPRVQKCVWSFVFWKLYQTTRKSFLLSQTKTYIDMKLRPTPTNWRFYVHS